MTRRWLGLTILGFLLTFPVLAADDPVVLQPGDPAFSPPQRAALLAAIEAVEEILAVGYPITRQKLIGDGWTESDFVQFTAGTLRSFGYSVVLVEADGWPDGRHTWVLAGIPLDDQTAWVPVEASPAMNPSYRTIGFVPWAGSSTSFDDRYLRFDSVSQLPHNRVPTVSLAKAGGDAVIHQMASFLVMTRNDDGVGRILAYQWTVDGELIADVSAPSFVYIFATAREHEVGVTVIDSLGGRVSASITFDVLETAGCGCG
jgi:hypothetical protein